MTIVADPHVIDSPRVDDPASGRRVPPSARRSGTSSLALLLAGVLVLPVLLMGIAGWFTWESTVAEARIEVDRAADTAAEYTRRLLDGLAQRADTANEVLRGLSDQQIREQEAALHERLRRIPERSGDQATFHVFVHDRDARSLVSGTLFPVPGPDRVFLHREFNQALRDVNAPAVHVSPVYLGEEIGRRFFAVSRRREGAGNGLDPGIYDGVIVVAVDPAAIEAAIRPVLGEPGDVIALLRADGAMLARSPAPLPGASLRLPPDSPVLPMMLRGEERARLEGRSTMDGVRRVLALRRVEGWPVYVSTGRPRSAILALWRDRMLAQAALGAPFILALAVLGQALRRGQQRLAAANADLEHRVRERTAALAESEARLRRAQQIGRVGGFEIDLRTGANLRSAEYMTLHGMAAREALEQHADWVRRLHPEDRVRAEQRFLDAIADDAPDRDYAQEYRIVTAEGEIRWIAARAEIERGSDGRALRMVGAHVDVTELRVAQAALAEAAQRAREVLESLGDMLYALDGEGRIRFASRRALEAWGRSAEEVLGRHFVEAFSAARGSASWAAIEQAARDGTELHLCAVSPLFGRWFELEIHPASGGGVTVAARDVHERRVLEIARRRAEAALREQEERLRLALEAARLGTWEIDLLAGTATRSPRTLEIFGFDQATVAATYPVWRDRIHPEDLPRFEAALAPVRAGAARHYQVQYRFQRPDGAWRWVESQGLAVATDPATGTPRRLIGTTLDITERKAAEERQRLLSREVDHRAKNALTVVQAALRLTPKHNAVEYARTVEGRVRAIARAQSLLAEGRWSGAELRTVAEGELSAFLPAAGGDARLAPRAVLDGPSLQLRPEAVQALSMALHELSTNAVKYGALSTPGGLVRFAWSLDAAGGVLRLRWAESGGPLLAAPPTRRGFGTRLLVATIRDQLGGQVDTLWAQDGLVCQMRVPVARVLAMAAPEDVRSAAE